MDKPTTFITLSGGSCLRVYGDYKDLKEFPYLGGMREFTQVAPFDWPEDPITIIAKYVASVSPGNPKSVDG